ARKASSSVGTMSWASRTKVPRIISDYSTTEEKSMSRPPTRKIKRASIKIRTHLGHIVKMFSSGNFKAPMLIHDTNPPGTATMTRLKEQIRYEFSETDRGARIRLVTSSPETTDAVHAFLLFQIVDHRTQDVPTISDDLFEEVIIPCGIPHRFYPAILPLPLSR